MEFRRLRLEILEKLLLKFPCGPELNWPLLGELLKLFDYPDIKVASEGSAGFVAHGVIPPSGLWPSKNESIPSRAVLGKMQEAYLNWLY